MQSKWRKKANWLMFYIWSHFLAPAATSRKNTTNTTENKTSIQNTGNYFHCFYFPSSPQFLKLGTFTITSDKVKVNTMIFRLTICTSIYFKSFNHLNTDSMFVQEGTWIINFVLTGLHCFCICNSCCDCLSTYTRHWHTYIQILKLLTKKVSAFTIGYSPIPFSFLT